MTRNKPLTLLIALVLLLLLAIPTLAQEQEQPEEEEPLPDCPALTDQPRDLRTSYYMGEGVAYLNSSQLSAAHLSFSCVIRVIDPSYVSAYMGRGFVYAREHAYEEAIEDYTRAVQLDSNLVAGYNNRGVVYAAIREFDRAAADFDRVLQLDPDYVPGYNNRSVVHAIQGDFDSAIALLEEAIDRSGIDNVLAQYQDPERPDDAQPIEFEAINARSYALLGIIYSARALDHYRDYLFLYNESGQFADERIQGAAGSLESQFTFEMRLDDGSWLLFADLSADGL